MSNTEINKYQNSKIYKIFNTINDEIYVGSTYQKLSQRIAKHRNDVSNDQKRKCAISKLMLEVGVANFYIELIEAYPCNSKEELAAREGYWIRQIGSLNKQIAGRTIKQYHDECKAEIAVRKKCYNEEHKDSIAQKKKQYHESNKQRIHERKRFKITCPCGNVYSHGDRARHFKTKTHQAYEESIKEA